MTQTYKDYKNSSGRITKTQVADFLFVWLLRYIWTDPLAEFRSVVKDTKSNTKIITKSISIHSGHQSVHFW